MWTIPLWLPVYSSNFANNHGNQLFQFSQLVTTSQPFFKGFPASIFNVEIVATIFSIWRYFNNKIAENDYLKILSQLSLTVIFAPGTQISRKLT